MWGLALAAQMLGRVALAAGDLEEAAGQLTRAGEMYRAIGARFEIARTAIDQARLAHARQNAAEARTWIELACAGFRAVGAPRHLERAEALARSCGAT